MPDDTVTDFAIAAYREEDAWIVAPLPLRMAGNLDGLVAALHQLPAESGALALVSVADDFLLLLRVRGADVLLFVSDAAAAEDYPIGQQALDALDAMEMLDGSDEDTAMVGHLDICADYGLGAMELTAICEDDTAFPDEMLSQVAERLGFGSEFDRAVDGSL